MINLKDKEESSSSELIKSVLSALMVIFSIAGCTKGVAWIGEELPGYEVKAKNHTYTSDKYTTVNDDEIIDEYYSGEDLMPSTDDY